MENKKKRRGMLAVLLGLQWGEHWAQLSDPWLARAAKVLGMVATGAAAGGWNTSCPRRRRRRRAAS